MGELQPCPDKKRATPADGPFQRDAALPASLMPTWIMYPWPQPRDAAPAKTAHHGSLGRSIRDHVGKAP